MTPKLLIIRLSSIGDIVLTSPIIRCLKQQTENAEVHFLTKEKNKDLVRANPYIDKLHLYNSNLNEIVQQLQQEKFDYIIDLHHNIRSQYVKQHLRKPAYTLRKLNIKKWLLIKLKINILPNIHIVDRMFDAIAPLGIKNDKKGLDHFIPEEDEFDLKQLPKDFHKGYVAIAIAGTYFTKRLPADKHLETISQAEVPYIILGGRNERPMAELIEQQTKGKVLNLCGKLSINQSASIVKQARLVIANDTGLMHIAAAFKKKILSIWGSTTPELGMTPYLAHPASQQQRVPGLKCQPCSKIGRHQCPKSHFRCMQEQNTTEMAQWILSNY